MKRFRISALSLFSTLGMGCAIAMPFRGPGLESGRVTGDGERTVVVSVTHAVLIPGEREAFDRYVRSLSELMDEQPGLIGFSLRKELFGDEAWTMTAWEDEASLVAFSRSPAHREAVEAARHGLRRARFRRVTIPASELPLSWDRALAILDEERPNVAVQAGRH